MMIGMTAKEKIAVSLPAQLVRAAKSAVRRGRAPNVSAYVADALADKVMLDDLSSLLDEMLKETGGPLTKAERRGADRILRGSRTRKG
jgi:Arc/MetJ-type ribon-helix-helix transcriptional regulator